MHLNKIAACIASAVLLMAPLPVSAEGEESKPYPDFRNYDPCTNRPFDSETGEHPAGCVFQQPIAIYFEIEEEPETEPEIIIDPNWVMCGIEGVYTGCLHVGSELYPPELPGVKGYTFGSGEIDVLPGAVVPVYESVWLYPVY